MLRQPAEFTKLTARSSIGQDTRVVAYNDYDYSGATHPREALHYYGHRRVAVLNGGWNKWLAKGRLIE